jgi:hypothetical protein
MADLEYMRGRQKYQRPQAMLWANNPGTVIEDTDSESPTFGQFFHVPLGNEINSAAYSITDTNEFIILSDHNRSDINFQTERLETKQRMVNGRMRSYFIADKLSISTSWDMIPSRAYSSYPDFSSAGEPNLVSSVSVETDGGTVIKSVKSSGSPYYSDQQFTVDGGAGGVDLLDWYERYTGSFWVYLSYDKHTNFKNLEDNDAQYANLNKYSQIVEVFFGSFRYDVVKRGGSNFDFWNIEVTLEEV